MAARRATSFSTSWRRSGSPPVSRILADAPLDGQPHHPFDFLEAEELRLGRPLLEDRGRIGHLRPVAAVKILGGLRFGQAIEAAKVAAIGQAHAEVPQNAPLRINELADLAHFGRGIYGRRAVGVGRRE